MAGKTNAERQEAYRQRQAEQAAAEVRGIFAHKDDHAAIKNYAARLAKKRTKAANYEERIKRWPMHLKRFGYNARAATRKMSGAGK